MVPDAVRSLLLMVWLSVLVTGCASKPEPEPVVDNSAEAGEFARQAWQAQQQGNTDEALAQYRQAFSLDPRNAMTANNLALLLREQGRFSEAVSMLRKAWSIRRIPKSCITTWRLFPSFTCSTWIRRYAITAVTGSLPMPKVNRWPGGSRTWKGGSSK